MNHVVRLTPWHTAWGVITAIPMAEMEQPSAAFIRQQATLALSYLDDVSFHLASKYTDWSSPDRAVMHRDMGLDMVHQALEEMLRISDAWLDNEPTHG